MNPLISVIVPCYNQAQFLDECLQSVLDQTYTDWECIIVNDGSPDHTEEVAKKWLEKDPRFRYIDKENGGLSSARNAGLKEAKGEWILPLDSDDKISVDYLFLAEKKFINNPTLIYSNAEYFGDKTGEWKLNEFSLNNLAKTNVIFCSAIFMKKKCLEVGGYDENLIYGYEDWDLWISLLKNGGNVYKIDKVCFYYRVKSKSMIKDLISSKRKYTLDYISKKHSEFFILQLGNFFDLINYKYKYEEIILNKSYEIFNEFFIKLWELKEKIRNFLK